MTAADVRDGEWVMKSKDFDRTGKYRHVYLTPEMIELTRALCEKTPTGRYSGICAGCHGRTTPSASGSATCVRSWACRRGVVATAMRHTWVTDALEAGIPIATVSETGRSPFHEDGGAGVQQAVGEESLTCGRRRKKR